MDISSILINVSFFIYLLAINLSMLDQICCSATPSCPTLWDFMNCIIPGFHVLYCSPEFAPIHVHWVHDAIQSSHPLSPPSPPAFTLCQHQGFPSELTLRIRWTEYLSFSLASVLPMNIQGWFPLGLTGLISLLPKGLSRVFSITTAQKQQYNESVWNGH